MREREHTQPHLKHQNQRIYLIYRYSMMERAHDIDTRHCVLAMCASGADAAVAILPCSMFIHFAWTTNILSDTPRERETSFNDDPIHKLTFRPTKERIEFGTVLSLYVEMKTIQKKNYKYETMLTSCNALDCQLACYELSRASFMRSNFFFCAR